MRKIVYILGIGAFLLTACQKEMTVSSDNNGEIAYTLQFASSSPRLFVAGNQADLELVNLSPEGDPVSVTESVVCQAYVPSNASELLASFNEKWASDCVLAPSDVYSLNSATMKSGTQNASIHLRVDTEKIKTKKSSHAYLIPLRLKTDCADVKSHALQFIVLPTYTTNAAGRTLVHFSTKNAYLEMYYTNQPNTKAMIFCPGGGYSELNNPVPTHYEGNGIAVGVLWYTLPVNQLIGRHDLVLQDAFDAIDILWANASRWGGYTKVGTAGRSAGGHLAATTAAYYSSKVDFQILLYAVINMNIGKSHEGSVHQFLGEYPTQEEIDAFTIYKQVNTQTPRAFITWCDDDSVVPQEFNCAPMALALEMSGVPVTKSVHKTGGHATGLDYPDCVLDWLKTF